MAGNRVAQRGEIGARGARKGPLGDADLHGIEIDAGDTFCFDAEANLDKEERETRAAERLFGLLGEKPFAPSFGELAVLDPVAGGGDGDDRQAALAIIGRDAGGCGDGEVDAEEECDCARADSCGMATIF